MKIYNSRIYILLCLTILSPYLIYSAAKITEASNLPLQKLLIEAIIDKDKDKVISLLKEGADVNAVDQYGRPILNLAIELQAGWPIVELLLNDNRINVNAAASKDQMTALHSAAEWEDEQAVKLLISKGAKINAKDAGNRTPLMIAVEFRDYKPRESRHFEEQVKLKNIIEILIREGADINAVYIGFPALKDAILKGDIQIVKMLLEAGAKIYEGAIEDTKYKKPYDNWDYIKKNKEQILQLLKAEPARRAAVLEKWNEQVAKQIKSATGLIPELSKIISQYESVENYDELPIEYRLGSIEEKKI